MRGPSGPLSCTYMCMHARVRTYVRCVHARACVCMCVCVRVRMCVCVRVHISSR